MTDPLSFPFSATLPVEMSVGSSLGDSRTTMTVDRQYRWRVEADAARRANPAVAVVAEFLNASGAWCVVRSLDTLERLLALTPVAVPNCPHCGTTDCGDCRNC